MVRSTPVAALLCLPVLVLALSLPGCGKPQSSHSVGSPPPAASIPFPENRGASTLTEYVFNGAAADQSSAGALPNGTAMVLSAEVGGYEYALYRFNPTGSGAGAPDSVSVLLEDGPTTEAWIGRADYDAGMWQFDGPFTKPKTLLLDEAKYISPDGNVWVAVMVAAEQTATVNALSVRTINPANESPVANFTRTPVLGNAPLTVSFDASTSFDPDGEIIEYAWDFEGTGGYSFFTDNPTTTYTYTTGAAYRPKLRITDDQGATSTQDRSMNVNDPPIAFLHTDTPKVNKGVTVFLDASGSSDPDGSITNYAWDLNGDGVFNDTAEEQAAQGSAAASVLMGDVPGLSPVAVRVTDDKGATATAALTLTVLGWLALAVDTTGSVGAYTSLAVVNGKPAISYYDDTNDDLKYAYSSSPQGTSDWNVVTVDFPGGVGDYTSLAVVNGMPAISYYDYINFDLKYAYSSAADGSSGWTVLTVDSPGVVGLYTSLAVVNGRPAISYFDGTNLDLKYAYSSTADGDNPVDWTALTVDAPGDVGLYTSLAVVNGKPAISYYDQTNADLKYAYSSTADGGNPVDWTALTVDAPGTVGWMTSLAVVNGKPAISYFDFTNEDLKYAYSGATNGSSGWTALTVDAPDNVGSHSSLAVVNGKPAISYYGSGGLKYASSSVANGSSGWSTQVVDSVGDVGFTTSLAVLPTGQPAISYFDFTNEDLKYAVLYE